MRSDCRQRCRRGDPTRLPPSGNTPRDPLTSMLASFPPASSPMLSKPQSVPKRNPTQDQPWPRTGAGTRPTSSSVSCYNCRRPGHIARDCLQPRRESTGLGRGTTTKDTEVKIIQSKDLEQEGDTPWLWTEAYYAGWPSRSRHHVWG